MGSLEEIKRNLLDLIEVKKERLRNVYQEEQDLVIEITELEHTWSKINDGKSIHLAVSNLGDAIIRTESKKMFQIPSEDILNYIRENGPTSSEDIRKRFSVGSDRIHGLQYLTEKGKIVKDGLDDKGRNKYSVNENWKSGT